MEESDESIQTWLINQNITELKSLYYAFTNLTGDTKKTLPFYDYIKFHLEHFEGIKINDELHSIIIEIEKQI